MILKVQNYCMGQDKASKYIEQLCNDIHFPFEVAMLTKSVTYDIGENKQLINFKEELESVKLNGKAKTLQFIYDSNDSYLKLPIEIGIYTEGATGIKFSTKSSYGSFLSELDGPGAIEASESSLSYDIINFRNKCIASFNDKNYSEFNYYRAFLFASVSLVDCFLHRYNFFIKEKIQNITEYDNLKELDSISPIENRLIAWMLTFATDKLDEIKTTKQWSQFMEIKKARNNIVHPTTPTISYSVKTIAKNPNLVKFGIGGLLLLMRKYARQRELIGFIQCIYNIPEIKLQE